MAVRGKLFKSLPVAEPDAQMGIIMLLEDVWVQSSHSLNGCIAQEDGIEPSVHRNANRCRWLGPVYAGAVITPKCRIVLGIKNCKFEEAGSGVGLPVHADLSAVADNGGGGVDKRSPECEKKKKYEFVIHEKRFA